MRVIRAGKSLGMGCLTRPLFKLSINGKLYQPTRVVKTLMSQPLMAM